MFAWAPVSIQQARTHILQVTPSDIENDSYSDTDTDTEEQAEFALEKKYSVLQKHDKAVYEQWCQLYINYTQQQALVTQIQTELRTAQQEQLVLLDDLIKVQDRLITYQSNQNTIIDLVQSAKSQLEQGTLSNADIGLLLQEVVRLCH